MFGPIGKLKIRGIVGAIIAAGWIYIKYLLFKNEQLEEDNAAHEKLEEITTKIDKSAKISEEKERERNKNASTDDWDSTI